MIFVLVVAVEQAGALVRAPHHQGPLEMETRT